MLNKAVGLIFLIFAAVSFSQKITDFRLAPASGADMDIGFYFSANAHQDQYYSRYQLCGSSWLNFEGSMESEPRIISGRLRFSYSPGLHRQWSKDTVDGQDVKTNHSSLCLSEELSGILYINNSNFFWLISGDGDLYWNYQNIDSIYRHDVHGYYDATGGIGFGRLRDGTPSWKAIEIMNILWHEGLIAERPLREEILGLAQILNQEWNCRVQYDRYYKFFYQKIEEYFEAIGIDTISAYLWFKIKEIVDEEVEPREFGLRLSSGYGLAGYSYATYEIIGNDTFSYMRGNPKGRLKICLQTAYPLNYRLQFRDNFNLYLDDDGVSFHSSTLFAYLIHTRLEASLGHNWDNYTDQYSQIKMKIQALNFSLRYYFEDRVWIDWSNRLRYQWQADEDVPQKYFSTMFSISYDML